MIQKETKSSETKAALLASKMNKVNSNFSSLYLLTSAVKYLTFCFYLQSSPNQSKQSSIEHDGSITVQWHIHGY